MLKTNVLLSLSVIALVGCQSYRELDGQATARAVHVTSHGGSASHQMITLTDGHPLFRNVEPRLLPLTPRPTPTPTPAPSKSPYDSTKQVDVTGRNPSSGSCV